MAKINKHFLGAIFAVFLSCISTVKAGIPIWAFEPLTSTTVAVASNTTAVVQYRVTNQSYRPHTLQLRPNPAITQLTTGPGVCSNPFVLAAKQSCILSLQINGEQLTQPISDGPVVCQQGSQLECYRPGANNILHISQDPPIFPVITVTGSPLILIANGASGQLIITNTSTQVAATNVRSNFNGTALEGNVTETGNTCADVAPGANCILSFTPGNTQVPQTNFTIAGNNTNTITAAIQIAAIGQVTAGGIVGCAGGGTQNLIVSVADNNPNIPWGGFGTATNAQSDSDGAANTQTIVACLTGPGGAPGCPQNININSYPAGICSTYEADDQGNPCQVGSTCYTDWFLPSIDQLECFYNNIAGDFIANDYWSSTEDAGFATNAAWILRFTDGTRGVMSKAQSNIVRCARSFSQ